METETRKPRASLQKHLWRTGVITALAAIIYYVPTLMVMAGKTTTDSVLYSLHDFYQIDFYALVFFAPVAYAAYNVGTRWALTTALASMLLLFPAAITKDHWVAVLQPTAFAIILAAVGAAISLLQRSDEQQRQRIQELEGLYDVGKAVENLQSLDTFLETTVRVIGSILPGESGVRLTYRDQRFENGEFSGTQPAVEEALMISEEKVGSLQVFSRHNLKNKRALLRTVAERISGAIREIELGQSLNQYYEQLEDMVETRTHELELVQEKLIRSEKLAAAGELASAVSHELRNPLNVIKNCVYLLNLVVEDGQIKDDGLRDTLNMIDQQVNISNRIVTDLLDFTRTRSPSTITTDLSVLVEQSISWVQVPPGITIVRSFGANGARLTIDPDQVGRALANILTNAIQAIVGGGRIKVSTAIEGDFARIDVEDTGCGIPQENMGKIFEPLFTTKPKGIGLGLAITRRLIEQNRGTIGVASEVGTGTTVSVKLPLERKESKNHEESAQRAGSR